MLKLDGRQGMKRQHRAVYTRGPTGSKPEPQVTEGSRGSHRGGLGADAFPFLGRDNKEERGGRGWKIICWALASDPSPGHHQGFWEPGKAPVFSAPLWLAQRATSGPGGTDLFGKGPRTPLSSV